MNELEIREQLTTWVQSDPGNTIPKTQKPIFDAPEVGVARADDGLFKEFQQSALIGPTHRLPSDWIENARSVISYFLPISDWINEANRTGDRPSESKVFARFYGELFSERLRRRLVSYLLDAGYQAVAPTLTPDFSVKDMNSNWSERHVGYAAGLGTFGLHAGLITRRGTSGRIGSVVTDLELPPSPRPEGGYQAYCLHARGFRCGQCLPRCPAKALHYSGKDQEACSDYLKKVQGPWCQRTYGFAYSPCGKCYVAIPCESVCPPDPIRS